MGTQTHGTHRRLAVAGAAMALLGLVGGCDMDSFLDPSIVGRWENTPVLLPIMERIDVIDEPDDTIAGLSQVSPPDLIPEITEYAFGEGDTVTITVFELQQTGADSVLTRTIDELGYIRLPVIGEVKVAGLTAKQLEQRIIDILHPDILRNPQVTVLVTEGRQRIFTVIGPGQGQYAIVKNNFRLLDAIAMARIPETQTIHIIRQIPLDQIVEKGAAPDPNQPGVQRDPLAPSGTGGAQKEPGDVLDPGKLIESLTDGLEDGDKPDDDQPAPKPEQQPDAPDAPGSGGAQPPSPALSEALDDPVGEGQFINVNGKWVLVKEAPGAKPAATNGESADAADGLPPIEKLMTQRIIEVPARQLMRGDMRYNIVIRPEDIIRVTDAGGGNVFIGGPGIGSPGTYTLPTDRSLTLKQLIISARGLAGIGIPERVDLIRRIGDDQEATVRVNLRAIFEGVQPDFFIKANDTINVGTNAVAGFAAVIRNSFRFSYGFGFLLDQNFGDVVFPNAGGTSSNN